MLDSANSRIFLNVVESIPCSIIIADVQHPTHPIVYANRAFEALTGYNRKEILGKNCRFLQNNDDQPAAREVLRRAIRDAKPCRVLVRNYKKDGSLFYNDLVLTPLAVNSRPLRYIAGVQTVAVPTVQSETGVAMVANVNAEKDVWRKQILANVEQSVLPLLKVMQDSTWQDTEQSSKILEASLRDLSSAFGLRISQPHYGLTPREVEICHYLRRGLSTKHIATLLSVASSTVENQRHSIRRKLGIANSPTSLVLHLRSL